MSLLSMALILNVDIVDTAGVDSDPVWPTVIFAGLFAASFDLDKASLLFGDVKLLDILIRNLVSRPVVR
jgi:hypothetical protein